MMGYVNKVFLMGNLTGDPELRHLPSGTPLADFGMAMNRNYKTKAGKEVEERCFVDVTFFGKRGEVICDYLSKGDQIFIEGRLHFDQWETSDGRRSKLVVTGEDFQFVGEKGRADIKEKRGTREDNPVEEHVYDEISDDELPL